MFDQYVACGDVPSYTVRVTPTTGEGTASGGLTFIRDSGAPIPNTRPLPALIMTSAVFEESWVTGPAGTNFYTRTYKADQPKALLVFVHGFAEHVGRYDHAHVKYPQKGITVFTYDARGFGKTALDAANRSKSSSYGRTSWKEQFGDIEWAIGHARNEVPGVPTFLMGHSMVGVWHVRVVFCG